MNLISPFLSQINRAIWLSVFYWNSFIPKKSLKRGHFGSWKWILSDRHLRKRSSFTFRREPLLVLLKNCKNMTSFVAPPSCSLLLSLSLSDLNSMTFALYARLGNLDRLCINTYPALIILGAWTRFYIIFNTCYVLFLIFTMDLYLILVSKYWPKRERELKPRTNLAYTTSLRSVS